MHTSFKYLNLTDAFIFSIKFVVIMNFGPFLKNVNRVIFLKVTGARLLRLRN
jgi:hypothetical protein